MQYRQGDVLLVKVDSLPVKKNKIENSLILIKGSRGMKMELVAQALKS